MSSEHEAPASLLAAAEDSLEKKPAEQHQHHHRERLFTKRSSVRGRSKESVMAVAFSPQDDMIAVGHFDGSLVIYDTFSMSRLHEINMAARKTEDREKLPVTALAFRPQNYSNKKQQQQQAKKEEGEEGEVNKEESTSSVTSSASSATTMTSLRPILLVCLSDGQWFQYDASSAECVRGGQEKDNEIYCCGYSCSGQHFATAGRDAFVRVYSEREGEVVKKFTIQPPGNDNAPLRVYSLRWHVTNPHIVFAGGWSQTITRFDIESRDGYVESARRIDVFGPVLMGDALAFSPRQIQQQKAYNELGEKEEQTFLTNEDQYNDPYPFDIFTASHRLDDRLEFFDAHHMSKTGDIPWPLASQPFLPLCATASSDGNWVGFGGGGGAGMQDGAFVVHAPSASKRLQAAMSVHAAKSGEKQNSEEPVPEAALRDHYFKLSSQPQPVVELRQPGQPVLCCTFSNNSQQVVFGDSVGVIHVFEVPKRKH